MQNTVTAIVASLVIGALVVSVLFCFRVQVDARQALAALILNARRASKGESTALSPKEAMDGGSDRPTKIAEAES